jgi:plasmid maintenance system killer protein
MLPRLWRDVRRTSANKIHTISADTDCVQYVLRVLRSVKSAEREHSLLATPLGHLELLESGEASIYSYVSLFVQKSSKPGTLSLILLPCCE